MQGKKQRKQLNRYITETMFLQASTLGHLNAEEMVLYRRGDGALSKEYKHQETKQAAARHGGKNLQLSDRQDFFP